jgi:hypothetical protein
MFSKTEIMEKFLNIFIPSKKIDLVLSGRELQGWPPFVQRLLP